ncbi:hypothetical protein ACFQFH_05685 [Halobaculum halobium]|uniref:PGF-pre-PGF domain-containing protein n=1 Tax=Halobaculum halobium TaxID=3032281 RepID=A0ABD5TDC6_9EURY|nr:hypothetical protein [Halobaculum sp. SYNS20]
MRDRTRRASAIAFVALLLVSTVAVGIPLASMNAAAAPSGMVALDGSSITEEVPSGESIPANASEFEGRIYSTEHAESMSLTLTTGGHADEVMNSDAVRLDGEGMVLVLADDENHGAREVAIEATVLSNSLGYVPKWAVGTHEDGSTWKRPVTYEDGYVRFEVPHFSSNAVSFESEVEITADAAVNASAFEYDIADGGLDAASKPTANWTGVTNTEWDNESASAVANGGSVSVPVAGNLAPTDETVTFGGTETLFAETRSGTSVTEGDTATISVNGDAAPRNGEVTFYGSGSSNSRTVSVTGASDGSTKAYDVGGNLAPTGESVTFTGETQTTNGDQSWSGVSLGNSVSLSNPGNIEPAGPGSNNNPTVTVTPQASSKQNPNGGQTAYTVPTIADGTSAQVVVKETGGTVTQVEFYINSLSGNPTADIYINGNGLDQSLQDGTQVRDSYAISSGWNTLSISSVDTGTGPVTIEFVDDGANGGDSASLGGDSGGSGYVEYNDGSWTDSGRIPAVSATYKLAESVSVDGVSYGTVTSSETQTIDITASQESLSTSGSGTVDISIDKTDRTATEDPSVDLDDDGTAEASVSGILTDGETATVSSFDVSTGSQTTTTNTNAGSTVSWDFDFTEESGVKDPTVDIDDDGQIDASYSGVLRDGETATEPVSLSTGSKTLDFGGSGSTYDWELAYDRVEHTENPSVDVDNDGTAEATYTGTLGPSESVTKAVNLSTSTSSVDVSTSSSTTVDVTVSFKERTGTDGAVLVVNGNETLPTGTLADGEQANATLSTDVLREGSNDVRVELADGFLSTDAPEMQVGLVYSHDTLDRKTVVYSAEKWSERYNVSKTFASERAEASMNITFEQNVVEIRTVEYRVNESGSWTALGPDYYTLDGNDISVDLDDAYGGEIPANTTIEVRTNGSRVQTNGMQISVTEATTTGDTLDSEISVDTVTTGEPSWIGVGPTSDGSRVHYSYDESYGSASDYTVIEANGDQQLHLPNAEPGDTLRVTHLPVSASPAKGDVKLTVEDSGGDPEIGVYPGPDGEGDAVEFGYYDTTDGTKYLLYSETSGIVRDSATANSPVFLTDDDSKELLVIRTENTSTSSTDDSSSDSGPFVPAGQFGEESNGGVSLGMLALIGVPLLGLAGAVVVYRRRGGDTTEDASTPVRVASTVGRAVSTGVRTLSGEPRVVAALSVLGGIALVLTGAVSLPPGTGLLLVIAGLPLVTFLVLRRLDSWSPLVFGTVSTVAVVLGLQLLGADPVGQVLDALGPGVLILALGLLVLAYQGIQAARAPEEVNEINIGDGDA